jgi:hypothetical protein
MKNENLFIIMYEEFKKVGKLEEFKNYKLKYDTNSLLT